MLLQIVSTSLRGPESVISYMFKVRKALRNKRCVCCSTLTGRSLLIGIAVFIFIGSSSAHPHAAAAIAPQRLGFYLVYRVIIDPDTESEYESKSDRANRPREIRDFAKLSL